MSRLWLFLSTGALPIFIQVLVPLILILIFPLPGFLFWVGLCGHWQTTWMFSCCLLCPHPSWIWPVNNSHVIISFVLSTAIWYPSKPKPKLPSICSEWVRACSEPRKKAARKEPRVLKSNAKGKFSIYFYVCMYVCICMYVCVRQI